MKNKNKFSKNKARSVLLVLCFLVFPNLVRAEFIDLPKDSNGWTIFTPSSDSRIMYVDPVSGDDTNAAINGIYTYETHPDWGNPFDPSGTINAFKTFTAAVENTRHEYPDFVLLKRGTTLRENTGGSPGESYTSMKSGRSVTEPSLFGAYGSGSIPVVEVGNGGRAVFTGGGVSYMAISGIDFYAYSRDPGNLEYVSTDYASGISWLSHSIYKARARLVEGCKFRFFVNGGHISLLTPEQGASFDGFMFRRNSFLDSYSQQQGHSQGVLIGGTDGEMIFEENIFDHNGWYSQAGSGGVGPATIFNHNIYMSDCKSVVFRNNISLRSSSIGIKFSAYKSITGLQSGPYVADGNLVVDAEVGITLAGDNTPVPLSNVDAVITNNIVTNLNRSRPTNREILWGIDVISVDGGLVRGNLIVHNSGGNSFGFRHSSFFQNLNVSDNIIYDFPGLGSGVIINGTGSDNVTFQNNKVQMSSGYIINTALDTSDDWVFSGNKYYSDAIDGHRFRYVGADVTDEQWALATGDNSSWEQVSFSDPTRSVESYMASIEETATIDAFISKARAQDRYNWDPRYTTESVNSWIRAGFITAEFRADVDGSSQITTTDALLTLRNSLGLLMNGTAWQTSVTTGDVNCDGDSNSTDALLILRHSLGLSMSGTSWCE